MVALILSLFLISFPISADAAPVMLQEQLLADQEESDPVDQEESDSVDQEESDSVGQEESDPKDQEESNPKDQEESDSKDQEDPPATPKPQKDVIKEYQQYTIYQSASVQSDPVASDSLDYMEESYYLLVMIASVLLFFLIVTICKLVYRFFDIFI